MSKVAVLAKLVAQEGKRDELVAVLSAQVDLVKDEEGTLVYALHTDMSDDVSVWFYEIYRDADALTFHSGTDAMKALGPKIAHLLAGRPEIKRLTPITAKGL
jgi:quinol monooxygenase YgiN